MVYVPMVFTLTVPVATSLLVISPSSASSTVARGSTNAPPTVTIIGFDPTTVITGA